MTTQNDYPGVFHDNVLSICATPVTHYHCEWGDRRREWQAGILYMMGKKWGDGNERQLCRSGEVPGSLLVLDNSVA